MAAVRPLRTGNLVRSVLFWLLLGLLVVGARPPLPAAAAPRVAAPFRTDRVLVAFHPKAALRDRVRAAGRLGLTTPEVAAGNEHVAVLELPAAARGNPEAVRSAVTALRMNPAVRVAEPDYLIEAARVPDDPRFPEQAGLRNVGQTGGTPDADVDAPEAWDSTVGSTAAVVAILDTGVDLRHQDLAPNLARDGAGGVVGFDFVNADAEPADDNGHGTHVAGIVGAVGNNALGVAGVCWTTRLLPVKVLDAAGRGNTAAAIAALDFARQNGARVINLSWTVGGGGFQQLMLEALQRARDAGILVVAAAGDGGGNSDDTPTYPASYNASLPNVLAVAAATDRDGLASFSNYGAGSVDLAAPGERILSTLPGDTYGLLSGTSMAAPFVSGAAALALSRFPALSLPALRLRLLAGADHPPLLERRVVAGRVNAAGTVEADDTFPAAPAALTLTHRASTALRLRWVAAGDDGFQGTAGLYELRYSTSPIDAAGFASAPVGTALPGPALSGTPQDYLLTGLQPDTAYFVALRALDNAGNVSPLVTAGPLRTLAQNCLLEDNVEGTPRFVGAGGWAVSTEQSFSPTRAYSDSPGRNYSELVSAGLTQAAPVTLGGPGSLLTFRARTDLEQGFDFLHVEIAVGGGPWESLLRLTGTSPFTLHSVSLSAFAEQTVRIRFRLTSDFVVNGDGVWIDDIRICSPLHSVSLLSDDVEGASRFRGDGTWAVTTEQSFSPTRSYSEAPFRNYDPNSDSSLTQIEPVPLTDVVPELSYRTLLDTELNADYLRVEVSGDVGVTWQRLRSLSGTSFTWIANSNALAGYAGQALRVRFRFTSDFFGVRSGVWVDDIRIGGEVLQAVPGSLEVTPAPVGVGAPLRVAYIAPGSTRPLDWVALFRAGAPNTDYLWWAYTGGAPSGEFRITAPDIAGDYEFRYLPNNGFTDTLRSARFAVTRNGYAVSALPNPVGPGGALAVNWTAPAGRPPLDWVALFRTDDPSTSFLDFRYTGGAPSGSALLTAPLQNGVYEVRYLLNDGYVDAVRSAPFTVSGAGGFDVAAGLATAAPGGNIPATWTAPAGRPSGDAIGLFAVGSAPGAQLVTRSTNGAASGGSTFTAPTRPGLYEFRYLTAGSGAVAARSGRFLVSSGGGYTVAAAPARVAPGNLIEVNWTAPTGHDPQEWIGLYRAGDPPNSYVAFQFTGGTAAGTFQFAAPPTPGAYEFRYMLSYAPVDAARSGTVTVTP